MLTNKEIASRIRGFFLPLRCIPEIDDYASKLRFKVVRTNGKIVRSSRIPLRAAQDERQLDSILQQVQMQMMEG